ncbi:nucleotidyltransferase domain-containing protein [Phenylobacterium sp.]|uniref:nucleotidyltransferase domain-containing protein n=1 Tax=Phenylobacterium sp. TaxID=1871053 RepID=UPI0035C7E2E0
MTSTYTKTTKSSNDALSELRASLSEIVPKDAVAITCGSYARREATVGSDLDFYVLVPAGTAAGESTWFEAAKRSIAKVVTKPPAADGAFDSCIPIGELLNNFGGEHDTNKTITRRMLYLLEGEYLTNEPEFRRIRRDIIQRYVSETREDRHLAQYLLNDIIRYWRTITVDYAFKTQDAGKPWAIRNIKLVFSRKLIYASGLFSVAMTPDRGQDEKIAIIEELFSMTPLDRMSEICGTDQVEGLRDCYDKFLAWMDDEKTRQHLEALPKTDRDSDDVFREIKDEGYRFGDELLKVFHSTFPGDHPIHRSVIF